jgi:transcriptional regulator with XRE-family HTH domain
MPKRKIDWYGPRLRELREGAGLSQDELGKRVSLAGSQINKLETNVSQPLLATALAIAAALNRPIADFVPSGVTVDVFPPTPKRPRGRPRKQSAAEPGQVEAEPNAATPAKGEGRGQAGKKPRPKKS